MDNCRKKKIEEAVQIGVRNYFRLEERSGFLMEQVYRALLEECISPLLLNLSLEYKASPEVLRVLGRIQRELGLDR